MQNEEPMRKPPTSRHVLLLHYEMPPSERHEAYIASDYDASQRASFNAISILRRAPHAYRLRRIDKLAR